MQTFFFCIFDGGLFTACKGSSLQLGRCRAEKVLRHMVSQFSFAAEYTNVSYIYYCFKIGVPKVWPTEPDHPAHSTDHGFQSGLTYGECWTDPAQGPGHTAYSTWGQSRMYAACRHAEYGTGLGHVPPAMPARDWTHMLDPACGDSL